MITSGILPAEVAQREHWRGKPRNGNGSLRIVPGVLPPRPRRRLLPEQWRDDSGLLLQTCNTPFATTLTTTTLAAAALALTLALATGALAIAAAGGALALAAAAGALALAVIAVFFCIG